MVVAERFEGAPHHGILKVPGTIVDADTAGVAKLKPEVAALPRDLLVKPDHAGSRASNGPLSREIGRSHVQVNAAGEIEASFDGRGDPGDQLDANHLCPQPLK